MLRRSSVLCLATFPALVAPAAAQDFLRSSAVTIPAGHVELAASPTLLFGRDGGPDRLGGSGRLGYGISSSFDAALEASVFQDFSLIGVDAAFRVPIEPIGMLVSLGAHKALIDDARDTTAFDVACLVSGRVGRRLDLSGGVSASFESLDGTSDQGFTRVYLGPGVRYRVSRDLDVHAQVGIGVNRHSPSYVSVGVSAYVPATDSASRRERR
jgi:hypothetical protein